MTIRLARFKDSWPGIECKVGPTPKMGVNQLESCPCSHALKSGKHDALMVQAGNLGKYISDFGQIFRFRGCGGMACTCEKTHAEKSTLWTDTGVDQNFQRAICPQEFQGKSVWTSRLLPCFQGKSVRTNGPESSSKVPPETGIGLWMALPSTSCQAILTGFDQQDCNRLLRHLVRRCLTPSTTLLLASGV